MIGIYVCHSFTSEREIGKCLKYSLSYSGPDEFGGCILPRRTPRMSYLTHEWVMFLCVHPIPCSLMTPITSKPSLQKLALGVQKTRSRQVSETQIKVFM